jgi:tetratricopeptide (TPR) repeat protein
MATDPSDDARRLAHETLRLLHAGKARRASQLAAQLARTAPGPLTLRLEALTLREVGRGARSLAPARAAMAQVPADPDTRLSVGASLGAAGRVAEALQELDQVLAVDPDHAPALRLSGELLLLRDPLAAEARLRRAVRAEPRSGMSRLLLARALERLGREEEAEAVEAAGLAADATLRRARQAQRSGRAVGLAGLAAVFVVSGGCWGLSRLMEQQWPGYGPGPALALGLVAPILPLLVIGWMAVQLARAEVDPPDPDLAALEKALGYEPPPGDHR